MKSAKVLRRIPDHRCRCCLVQYLPWKAGSPAAYVMHRDYTIGMHTHEFLEINIVMRGHGRHYIEKESFPVKPGDTFVIPAAVRHGYVGSKGLDVYHLLLHPDFARRHHDSWMQIPGFLMLFTVAPYFRQETAFRHCVRLDSKNRTQAKTLLTTIEHELQADRAGWEFAVAGLLHYFVVLLCRAYADQHSLPAQNLWTHRPMQGFQAALEMAAERYAEKLSLRDFARAAHMQPSYFCRMFHKIIGLTPMEYLNKVRVEAARKLLRETDLSISRIALDTGFCDGPHLARIFKQIDGTPPREFRRRQVSTPTPLFKAGPAL